MIILRKSVPGINDRNLAHFVARVCRAARVRGTVNVLVTGNTELRGLNHRFLGKDAPTDVLSFSPMPGFGEDLAGDIAISAEIAAQNAHLLGHSSAEEVKILALHGVLHLAGYDHDNDRGEMAKKESRLRRALGLPVGLTERNAPPPGPRKKAKAAGRRARPTR